jgi:hypothetical protein
VILVSSPIASPALLSATCPEKSGGRAGALDIYAPPHRLGILMKTDLS